MEHKGGGLRHQTHMGAVNGVAYFAKGVVRIFVGMCRALIPWQPCLQRQ